MWTQSEQSERVKSIWESLAGAEGKRWARPEAPVLHSLADEKEEPLVFFHNTNYRVSRKYINVEKVKVRACVVCRGAAVGCRGAWAGACWCLALQACCLTYMAADTEGAGAGVRALCGPCASPQVHGGGACAQACA